MDAIEKSARDAERKLSVIRAAFCALVALRFIAIWISRSDDNDLGRALQMLPTTLGAMTFSLWMIRRARNPNPIGRLLVVSVLVDAVVCTSVLASNVMWPFASYRGVLHLPETATFMAMVMAAGYRIYPTLSWLGAIVNCTCLAVLVWVDSTVNASRIIQAADLSALYVILMGAASVIAIATSRRTMRLVETARAQALQIGHAEREFGVLLEDHHDASSLLSAVRLDLDGLRKDPALARRVEPLVDDLRSIDETIRCLRQRSSVQALALSPPETFAVRASTLAIRGQLERVVAPMQLNWQIMETEHKLTLAGGVQAYHRVLLNLLSNAAQGDGRVGAESANVALSHADGRIHVVVKDDGPGIIDVAFSTKAEGTGAGLPLVNALVQAGGGTLEIGNHEYGALVTVTWPVT